MSPMTVPDHSSINNPMTSMRSANPMTSMRSAGQVYQIFLAKAKSGELTKMQSFRKTRQNLSPRSVGCS